MVTQATAAVLSQVNKPFSLERIELGELVEDEILVRIDASGICRTDLEASKGMVTPPVVLGHEGTGVVEQIGPGVNQVEIGDRVVISYGSCGICPSCMNGNNYACDNAMQINMGGRRLDGSSTLKWRNEPISGAFFQQSSFATYSITTVRNVVRVSDSMDPKILAALPCGVLTGAGTVFNSLEAGSENSMVVFGAGAVGLSAIMAANIVGVRPLIAVDVNGERLKLARELGATHVFDVKEGEIVERIRDLVPRGTNYAIETSGNDKALQNAIESLGMAGQCCIVAPPAPDSVVHPIALLGKAATLRGILAGSSIPQILLPMLIELYLQGRYPIDRLITTYRFENINTAFEELENGQAVKPVLLMD